MLAVTCYINMHNFSIILVLLIKKVDEDQCVEMHPIAYQGVKAAFKSTKILHFYHYGYR